MKPFMIALTVLVTFGLQSIFSGLGLDMDRHSTEPHSPTNPDAETVVQTAVTEARTDDAISLK